MKCIFDDSKYVKDETARCRLFELEELRINFEQRVFVYETTVYDYSSDVKTRKQSDVELLFAETTGKAIRKAIDNFDAFCDMWFDE